MPGYENQDVTHIAGENVYEQNRDLIGPDHNFSRFCQKTNGWNWLARSKTDVWNPYWMAGMSLSAGLLHAWLWQHCIFQWTPSMTRLTRLPLFAIPTMAVWYYTDKYWRTKYHPEMQDKHTLHQLLNRVANSARYEAYKQQVEGLVGERGDT
eukprot:529272_1